MKYDDEGQQQYQQQYQPSRRARSFSRDARLNPQGLRGRIDASPPSAEKAAGFTSLHRDTDGRVIGGIGPNGVPYGSKVRQGPLMGRLSLGQPVTLGLDAQAAANTDALGGAANLAGRQKLHQDMVTAGRGGLTPEMTERGKALGVSGSAFRRVAGGIPQAPGMIAATPAAMPQNGSASIPPVLQTPATVVAPLADTPTPLIDNPTPEQAAISARGTFAPGQAPPMKPAPPIPVARPVTGGELATANIASMGQAGAVADFQKRDAADKERRRSRFAQARV